MYYSCIAKRTASRHVLITEPSYMHAYKGHPGRRAHNHPAKTSLN